MKRSIAMTVSEFLDQEYAQAQAQGCSDLWGLHLGLFMALLVKGASKAIAGQAVTEYQRLKTGVDVSELPEWKQMYGGDRND